MTSDQLVPLERMTFDDAAAPDRRTLRRRLRHLTRFRSRRPVMTAAALLLFCGGTAWLWPAAPGKTPALLTGLAFFRDRPPLLALEVRTVDAPVLWAGPTPPLSTLTVANSSATLQPARVWWILGRRGDRAPWRDPVLESLHVAVGVPGHGVAAVIVAPPPGSSFPANGSYTMTYWVHTVLPNGTDAHSDGVQMSSSVVVASPSPALRETVIDQASTLRVIDLHAPLRVSSGARLNVSSTVATEDAVELSIELETVATDERGDAVSSAPIQLVLDPGAPTVVPTRLAIPPSWTGTIHVKTAVSQLLPDGSAVPSVAASLVPPVRLD